jgi:hypothetical protein
LAAELTGTSNNAGGSGGRAQPHPGGRGVPLDVDLRQNLVVAERRAKQERGHDRHTLGAQATALNIGAMDADERGGRDAQQAAESLGLPADGRQGAVKAVVVVPDEPIGALVDLSGPLLGVDYKTPLGPMTR